MLPQPYINQAIFFAIVIALCAGVVTMLSWTKDLLFSACRVVRRVYRELQR